MRFSKKMSLVLPLACAVSAQTTQINTCDCGYLDSNTGGLYTDAIIVYFNETAALPNGSFLAQSYSNPYEKNWNARYRQGAIAENIAIGNDSTDIASVSTQSLELYLNPSLADHLVVGGGIQSVRQDIQYGTIRSSMKSPGPWIGGSALSMVLQYNDTQSWTVNLQNTNNASTAWVSTLLHNEFASRAYGVNYTYLLESAAANGTSSPWDFMDIKVDWNSTDLNYFIGSNLSRSVNHERDGPIPTVPSPLFFKHWSNGDPYAMEGPPYTRTVANVGWVRAFFNVSTMDTLAHEAFDARCQAVNACNVDDMTLRGSTSYPIEATYKWKQINPTNSFRWPALGVTGFCLLFTGLVILNAALRKFWLAKKPKKGKNPSPKQLSTTDASLQTLDKKRHQYESSFSSGTLTPRNTSYVSSTAQTLVAPTPIPGRSRQHSTAGLLAGVNAKVSAFDLVSRSETEKLDATMTRKEPFALLEEKLDSERAEEVRQYSASAYTQNSSPGGSLKGKQPAFKLNTVLEPTNLPVIIPPKKRVDYLAGLLAFCAILVTFIHFSLTFIPALVQPGSEVHYSAELWVAKTVEPYLLNYTWVGLFLAVSTRFLVENYIKNGNLQNVALKTVGRLPRLMVPVTCLILLEYFFLDIGATHWLEYLPSITYSTWPYEVVFPNFGEFINETLELAYLTPNAMPRITFNYCVGVLWTIPVQIQGSWQALIGAMVVRELKSPWKKFAYYVFCIALAWYARNWASIFYFGLMLTDLDVRHHYRKWLHARPIIYYPFVLFLLAAGFGGLTMDATQAWSTTSIAVIENGWHPDQATGLPISQTFNAGEYPEYYAPKLSGLVFAFGALTLVEISPLVQRLLSFKFLTWIFPHIFTLYLLHGFIFWSLGSTLVVYFAAHAQLPYWANMLLTAVICYTVLSVALMILSPVVEGLGMDASKFLWRVATEKSPPRRRTLFPFPGDLLDENKTASEMHPSMEGSGPGSFSEATLKGKDDIHVMIQKRSDDDEDIVKEKKAALARVHEI